ncbi:MAG: hypothetical protein WC356_02860 [Candidatus Micrarchaeia archaeon]|jgi:hypothetical protein
MENNMKMKKYYGEVAFEVFNNSFKRATKYVSDNLTVKATSRCVRAAKELILTAGKPNYAERKFIKLCKKAGEKFPIKKIQLKLYSKKGK